MRQSVVHGEQAFIFRCRERELIFWNFWYFLEDPLTSIRCPFFRRFSIYWYFWNFCGPFKH